jgi:hypothetical protein
MVGVRHRHVEGAGVRLMYSTVERIGPDERDPSTFEIKLAPTPGLADPSLRIAADQVDGFLAIVGVASQGDLVGRPIRVTVDDEQGIERISFLTVAKQAEAAAPVAISSTGPTGPTEPAGAAEPVAASVAEPADVTRGIPVMTAASTSDNVTVYDGAGRDWALSADSDGDCVESAALLTPAEQTVEAQARVDLAAASAAPLERRYFLYRETYRRGARQGVIELTPEEFLLLGGAGAYLHVDDCAAIESRAVPPDTVQGIERLLARATSRPEASLPRPELEQLVAAGHVVSCAVY